MPNGQIQRVTFVVFKAQYHFFIFGENYHAVRWCNKF